MRGTFYIPARNPERAVMTISEIRDLSRSFEVGSHTLNHTPLKHLEDPEARVEIQDGKAWLEDVVGESVMCFCYPRGKFNRRTPLLVREAGFSMARTCMFDLNDFPRNPFLWGISSHASSHTVPVQFRHALLERNFRGMWQFVSQQRLARDWLDHFRNAVQVVLRRGGIAHLYLHGWEIDFHNEWTRFERLLAEVGSYESLQRVSNGELARLLQQRGGVHANVK